MSIAARAQHRATSEKSMDMIRRRAREHPARYKKLGEERIMKISMGQSPRIMGIGPVKNVPRQVLSASPGNIFTVTSDERGRLDKVGLGSVAYALLHFRIERLIAWGDYRATQAELEAAGFKKQLGMLERLVYTNGAGRRGAATPGAAVLSCSDSRITRSIFGGDAYVISNAGNILSPLAIAAMAGLVREGVPAIVVLGHTDCGAVGAALSGNNEKHLETILSVVGENIRRGEPDGNSAKKAVRKVMSNRNFEAVSPSEGREFVERLNAEVLNAVSTVNAIRGKTFANYFGPELQELQGLVRETGTAVIPMFLDLATGEIEEI